MLRTDQVIKKCRAGARIDLGRHDPDATFGWEKEAAKLALGAEQALLVDLVHRLHAEKRRGVLVVFQAVDAGGKGGTIRTVFSGLEPAGVVVTSFGVPSKDELAHDYLWRIHAHAPRRGSIAVFDRSHYEDVFVVRVKNLVPESVWGKRYGHIRNWEAMLADEGIHTVKFLLNTSREKQRERLQDRIDSPDERWKFRLGDLEDRALWDEYQTAFQAALRETSTDTAPWYVIPGDRKWVRNLAVARILRHHLEKLDPRFPPAEEGIEGLIVE